MTHLVIPDRIVIHAHCWIPHGPMPYHGAPIAFHIHTYARAKNDYVLGPFFSDSAGTLTLTRQACERSADAALSSGLMDFAPLGESFSFVEIQHLSPEDIQRAMTARTTVWKTEQPSDRELYGSLARLLDLYRTAGNHDLQPPRFRGIRDEWDGTRAAVEYEYVVERRI